MCFNPTVSLIAFTLSIVSFVVLIRLKLYPASVIVFYTSLMQLLEYFAHNSILEKNTTMNVVTSKLIFFFVFIQPLLFYLSSLITKGKYVVPNSERFFFLIPLYIVFCASFYVYLDKRSLFKSTYLDDSCQSVCRMSWDFFGNNLWYSSIALLLYILICLVFYKNSVLHFYAITMFVIALLYTIYFTRDMKQIWAVFGSIWCFLAVTYGPMVIYRHFNPS